MFLSWGAPIVTPCALSCIAAWFKNKEIKHVWPWDSLVSKRPNGSNNSNPEHLISTAPPAERTSWYNNCLCGRKTCHICYSRARGLGNVKYFQAVIRCELDWNRKSWQGAQQLSKDKGEHRWSPCIRNFVLNCPGMFWLFIPLDGVKMRC